MSNAGQASKWDGGTTSNHMKPATWRTTIVGILTLIFVALRVSWRHESAFDTETIALFTAGCALIAGTDKILGR